MDPRWQTCRKLSTCIQLKHIRRPCVCVLLFFLFVLFFFSQQIDNNRPIRKNQQNRNSDKEFVWRSWREKTKMMEIHTSNSADIVEMMVGKVTKVLIVPLCYGRYRQHAGTFKKTKKLFIFFSYFYYISMCVLTPPYYKPSSTYHIFIILKKKKGKIFFLSFLGIRKKCDRPISLRENRLIFLLQLRIDMLNNQIWNKIEI